ncbi:MAG TPA: zinc ribbon domain-containing protein [Kofleriaceae bacterium]
MPTYEYRCNACGRNFEYVQRMADDDLVTCEACGQPKLEKLISRTAFQLKGSGWYKDLYSSAPAQAMKDSVDKSGLPAKDGAKAEGAAAAPAPSSDSGGGSSGGGSDSGGGSTGGGSTSGGSSSGGSSSGGSTGGGTSSGGTSGGGTSSTSSS